MVTGKWTFKIKRDGRYKARQVLKGYEQIKGLNYQEIFAAVARADSYKLLIALAALHNWEINIIDIENAFFNGDINFKIYIKLLERSNSDNTV